MMLIKMVAAFCLGLAGLAALQTAGIWSLQQHLKSNPGAGLPVIGKGPDFATSTRAGSKRSCRNTA